MTKFATFRESPDAMQRICDFLVDGGSLLGFCKQHGFAYMTVADWIAKDPERAGNYARAREARADARFEVIAEYSDQAKKETDPVRIQGLRLASENEKWMLARMSPRYGDKVQIGGAADLPPVQSTVTVDAGEAYKAMLGAEK